MCAKMFFAVYSYIHIRIHKGPCLEGSLYFMSSPSFVRIVQCVEMGEDLEAPQVNI